MSKSTTGEENKLKTIALITLGPKSTENSQKWTKENLTQAIFDKYFNDVSQLVENNDVNGIELTELINSTDQNTAEITESSSDVWIFGYGSLIWKTNFDFIKKKPGYVKGYVRKFFQNSIDHRGTLEKPGRVVTLIPSSDPDAKVFGVAYRISTQRKDSVIKGLDFREKNGYLRVPVKFYTHPSASNDEPIDAVAYMATEGCDSYVGDVHTIDEVVEQIFHAKGPSGSNREYVYKLANAMRQFFPDVNDNDLFLLEQKLRAKEQEIALKANQIKKSLGVVINNYIVGEMPMQNILEQVKSIGSTSKME